MSWAPDEAKKIRAKFKARGWSSRDISVRSKTYSGGSSIRIEIRNPKIKKSEVEALARDHESVRRDGYGEILSGGNMFLFIDYAEECRRAMAADYVHPLLNAITKLKLAGKDSTALFPVVEGVLVGYDGVGGAAYRLFVEDHDRIGHAAMHFSGHDEGSLQFGAFMVARYVQEGGRA